VDDASREFLRHLAIDVRVEFGELPIGKMTSDMGYITSQRWQEFTASSAWKKYQNELLEVADLQAHPSYQELDAPSEESTTETIEEHFAGIRALISSQPTEASHKNTDGAAGPLSKTLGEQLEELRVECDEISIEQLADKVGIDPTNVSRHLSGKSKPNPKSRIAYGRVFSKLLTEHIVISKTQVKRSKNAGKTQP